MTDERNNNNNNNNTKNNNKTSNNYNKDTGAEATKIVLKNGLNGAATATATTLLTAPATAINPPPPPPALSTHVNFALYAAPPTATAAATTFGFCINNGISSTTLRTSTAATEEATKHQRVSPSSATTTAATTTATTSNAMAAATATPTTKELLSASERLSHGAPTVNSSGGGGGLKVENGGIIDYTLNANSSDIDRHPISAANELPRGQSFGGRLQFFKDGKFILELARSKDGEKGGWVSVPRKLFRAPSSATSSTITPTSTTSTTYPKNESSTSLSFSDDNSSIQSSPWQRDHCWKQAAPRYCISKEMSLFYQRPNQLTLSAIGLQASRKKRRRPFDNTSTPSWENTFMSLDEQLDENRTPNGMLKGKTSTHIHDVCVDDKPEGNISGSGNNSEDDGCSSSSTGTLTGTDCIDGSMVAQTPTPNSAPADLITVSEKGNSTKTEVDAETENAAKSADKDFAPVKTDERMNTSADDNDKDVSMAVATTAAGDETAKEQMNGEVNINKVEVPVTLSPPVAAVEVNAASEEKRASVGAGEKRLKKFKSRAKLITIIQKLIDRIPTAGLLYLSKTLQPMISGNGGGATFNQGNSLANKISPPSSSTSSPASAATSRLVELQYHQQHVSPRKRILREFEKVSLEDTGTAGGKRSRAKGNTSISSVKTSPQRVQSTSCAVLTSTSTATMATATNGGFNKSASKSTPSAPPTSSTPTRLYSSYSIHSLLGGGNSSSLNTPATPSSASTSKRLNEHAVVSNINYQQHQHQNMQHNFPDPSYLRAMLASPKSPENNCGSGGNCGVGGGKSPPNATKKRSPPYSSPLYEHHSRSPTVSVQQPISDYGSRSPGAAPPESNYKIRFAADHAAAALPSSQLQHHQGFYSPYMMSPKYVPTPPTSMSPNSMSSANTARSSRNSSVFSTHIPSSNTSSAPNSIPTRELSPPRSATAPPRESTPRTVPKKTASIRRQFASPTSTASPSERFDDQQQERKASLTTASTAGSHQQNSFQTVSPNSHHLGGPTLPVSPLHYYMYAPNNAGSSSPNAVGSSSASGTSVAAQAAALAAAYIPSVVPPYYHPYISTLAALRHNPMWMHHYPGATPPVMPPHSSASPQASSRLSPPFINFSYNGVGAATVAAAAAAAAAFGGPIPPSHFSQVGLAHQMSAPSAIHHAAGTFVGRSTHSPRLMTDENCIRTKTATKQTTASTIYPSSIKDEHSSDVPLNLSKH